MSNFNHPNIYEGGEYNHLTNQNECRVVTATRKLGARFYHPMRYDMLKQWLPDNYDCPDKECMIHVIACPCIMWTNLGEDKMNEKFKFCSCIEPEIDMTKFDPLWHRVGRKTLLFIFGSPTYEIAHCFSPNGKSFDSMIFHADEEAYYYLESRAGSFVYLPIGSSLDDFMAAARLNPLRPHPFKIKVPPVEVKTLAEFIEAKYPDIMKEYKEELKRITKLSYESLPGEVTSFKQGNENAGKSDDTVQV